MNLLKNDKYKQLSEIKTREKETIVETYGELREDETSRLTDYE